MLSALHVLTRLVFIAILEGRVVPQDSLEDGPNTPTHQCGLHLVTSFSQTEYSASSGVSAWGRDGIGLRGHYLSHSRAWLWLAIPLLKNKKTDL